MPLFTLTYISLPTMVMMTFSNLNSFKDVIKLTIIRERLPDAIECGKLIFSSAVKAFWLVLWYLEVLLL